MNDVLWDFLNHFVFIYLNDILIYSKSLDEHRVHVHQVPQRLLENKLSVNGEKYEFHVEMVSFLGYIIKRGQIQVDLDKVQATLK